MPADAVAAALAGAKPYGSRDRSGADRGTPARRAIGVANVTGISRARSASGGCRCSISTMLSA